MSDTTQIPVCPYPHCVNEMSTVGHEGVVKLPHPRRSSCRPTRADERVQTRVVRPLRDDPIETNADGGSQSVIEHTFGTMPLNALSALSQLQRLGDQKYGAHNWRHIAEPDHIDHAFAHLLGHCTGDRTEDHLLHAAWRLLAALEVRLTKSTFYKEEDDE
jgi:hypothetical protein